MIFTNNLSPNYNKIDAKKIYPAIQIYKVSTNVFSPRLDRLNFPFSLFDKRNEKYPTKSKASISVRGQTGDLWADIILGQPDFSEGAVKERVTYKVNNPGGVLVDRNFHPNRVYVSDNANSRILGYSSLGTCSNSITAPCTSNSDYLGGKCNLSQNKPADIIIGQPDPSRAACNGDSGYQNYPQRATPSAQTLCGMPEIQISPLEGGAFVSFDVDSQGNLYYPDWLNNRVLKYNEPFSSDNIADEVWGQDNFSSYECNKGQLTPSNSSICLGNNTPYNPAFVSGLDIDNQGNLWLTDVLNNRVLRFPYDPSLGSPSKSADLVLGQKDFSSRIKGSDLTQLKYPGAVKVDPNGNVFVADTGNNRILHYPFPQTTGMAGEPWGSNFNYPAGLEFDLDNQGIWVSDLMNNMVELWNLEGTQVNKVLFKDIYSLEPRSATCNSPVSICNLNDTRGSIGITSDGDLFLSSSDGEQDVVRFPAPIPTPTVGVLPAADFRLYYPPSGHNLLTGRSFASPMGITVKNNQLIVSDGFRIMFWNNPPSLTNWQMADGVVGAPDFYSENPNNYGRLKADDSGHLYVIHKFNIEIYQLPLTNGAIPVKIIPPQIPNLEGEIIDLSTNGDLVNSGIYPSADGSFLWLSHSFSHRVVRIRNPLTNPVIDVVLGQQTAYDSSCNQGKSKTNSTLCYPGSITLDNFNNVYVADNSLEVAGNGRLLEYDASNFPLGNTQTIYNVPANRILIADKHVFEPSFDSENRMIIGYNPYNYTNAKHSIDYFNDILNNPVPSGSFEDFYAMAYSTASDSSGNLYVLDHNRWKVNIYLQPFASLTPSSIPSPTSYPNNEPTIITNSLPQGRINKNYNATIKGKDDDPNDILTMSISNLPNGLTKGACSISVKEFLTISCKIVGTPTESGTFNVLVTVFDNHNASSTKTIPLKIRL